MATSLGAGYIIDLDGNEVRMEQLNLNGTAYSAAELTNAVTAAGGGTNLVVPTGGLIDVDGATATLSSHAATITKYAAQITTEALTTAAGASQAFTITKTGVAATDLIFVQYSGGTNTNESIVFKAVATSNTITVTVYNVHASAALNGTLIFNVWVVRP